MEELSIPPNTEGNHKLTLTISKEDSIYKTKEFSFIIGIDVPNRSNMFPLYLFIVLLVVITVLSLGILKTYVYKPLKAKTLNNLLTITQKFKDTMNIETILISNKLSGIHLYSMTFSLLKDYQNELLSGFIQAITLISNEIVGKEQIEKISIKSGKFKSKEKIIELDFKHFNFFISDYQDLRAVFILKDKASERFKNKTAEFLSELHQLTIDHLTNWDGNLEIFDKVLPSLLEKHFHIYYREKFTVNPYVDLLKASRNGEFSKITKRLLNVILSITRQNPTFYLKDAVAAVHRVNREEVIEALEILIENQLVITNSKEILGSLGIK